MLLTKGIKAALAALILSAGLLPAAAQAGDNCLRAAQRLQDERHIPHDLLLGIVEVESTGQATLVNAHGRDTAYRSADAAATAAGRLLDQGATIYAGCAQLDLGQHLDRFDDLADAFDPSSNVMAAADLLGELKRRYGSWEKAVKAYNAGHPVRSNAYLHRVETAAKRAKARVVLASR